VSKLDSTISVGGMNDWHLSVDALYGDQIGSSSSEEFGSPVFANCVQ